MSEMLHAYRRVAALAELAHRNLAIIKGHLDVLREIAEVTDGEVRERIRQAIADTDAQISAANDALDATIAELPEGQVDPDDSPFNLPDGDDGMGTEPDPYGVPDWAIIAILALLVVGFCVAFVLSW